MTQAPQEKRSDTSHSAPTRETDIASQTTLGPNQEKARSDSEPSAKQSATNIASAEIPMSKMTLNETDPVEASSSEAGPALTQIHETVAQGRQRRRMESHSARNELFFTDVNGSGMPVDTGLPRPRIQRSPSPTPSDSSEEIILFAGRHGPQSQMSKGQAPKFAPEQIPRQMPTDLQPSAKKTGRVVIDDPIGQSLLGSTSKQKLCLIDPQSATKAASDGYQLRNTNEERATNTKKLRRGKRGNASAKAAKEAEILADYVANTQDSDDLDGFAKGSGLNHRDLGGSDTAEWQDEEESSAFEEEADIVMNGTEDWDSADLQDFDDLSTSSEAPDAIAQIIYKRKRPSGKQYLVVGRGFTVDDARWLPLSALIMPGASEMIVEFEEEQAKFEQLLGDSDDSDESLTKDEQVARDLQEQMDDMEDERDLEERRIARKTDEQIAQLLSKQEELGLGSDSLILFNATDFDGDEVEEVPQLDGTLTTIRQSAPRARRKPGSRGTQPSFPSATTFAAVLDQDPYSGFDVMDHDRPSLRKLLKGRRGKLPIKLSDSEVEQSLNMAWENDRSKKKFRKQEREELRTQGLLGKKGKLDIKAKYSEGMTLEEVKKEIRNFLCSSLERYKSNVSWLSFVTDHVRQSALTTNGPWRAQNRPRDCQCLQDEIQVRWWWKIPFSCSLQNFQNDPV